MNRPRMPKNAPLDTVMFVPVRGPMFDSSWVMELRDRCVEKGVAFFFKQWGGRTPKAGGRELQGRTWDEYPEPAISVA